MTLLDITSDQYHADQLTDDDTPSLSASIAKLLLTRSPAHARAAHPRLNPQAVRVAEDKFDRGTVAHQLLLERDESRVYIVDAPDWRTKDAQASRAYARGLGKTPLLVSQWEAVREMVDAARDNIAGHDADPPLFTDGRPEQTITWNENGVRCRALLDWLRDDHEAYDDLKTTSRSANPDGWCRNTLWSIGADVQAAFYTRGLRAVTGRDIPVRFVVVETEPPFALSVVSLGPAAMELAHAKVDHALELWAHCLATDTWPGYPTKVCYADAPPWEETRFLELRDREAA